jgi:exodeoxyribonuclease VII large subunit
MQGLEAIPSLRQAFSEVKKEAADFDFLVFIRGGGSRLDLQVFDEFDVAAALADCPIPVLTGIGHERDESICDLVAARFFKTPTAVADFLIGQSSEAESEVNRQISKISSSLQWAVRSREMDMEKSLHQISQALSRQANRMDSKLRQEESRISLASQRKLHQLETGLVSLETMLKAGNPARILELGYARIFQDGKRKKSKAEISVSSPLKIQLKDGEINSNPI